MKIDHRTLLKHGTQVGNLCEVILTEPIILDSRVREHFVQSLSTHNYIFDIQLKATLIKLRYYKYLGDYYILASLIDIVTKEGCLHIGVAITEHELLAYKIPQGEVILDKLQRQVSGLTTALTTYPHKESDPEQVVVKFTDSIQELNDFIKSDELYKRHQPIIKEILDARPK